MTTPTNTAAPERTSWLRRQHLERYVIGWLLIVAWGGYRWLHATPKNADDARGFIAGTWTGSQDDGGIVTWRRLDFEPGGTYRGYMADPTDDGWGDPITQGTWTTGTAKYTDTGERYVYVELQWDTHGTPYAIDGGNVYTTRYPIEGRAIQVVTDGVREARLTKGDHFPY